MIGLEPPWVVLGGVVAATVVITIAKPPASDLPGPRLAGELAAIAKRYLAAHPDVEPCVTATPAQQSAMESRLTRWIDRQFPDETDDGNLAVKIACDGIVEVSEDRTRKGHPDDEARVHATSTARSWILRVDREITVLAKAEGIGEATRMESSPEARVTVIGQVDLDGDGTRDVVWAREDLGSGNTTADYQVSVWRSTSHTSSPIVNLWGIHDLEVSQDRVLAIYPGGGIDSWIYRCIDGALAVTTCPAAAARRRSVKATALAHDYTYDTASPSDREELETDLDLLEVPIVDRPRLLAMVAPQSRPDAVRSGVTTFERAPEPDDGFAEIAHRTHLAASAPTPR